MVKYNELLEKYFKELPEDEVEFYHNLAIQYCEENPGDYVLVLPCLVLPVSSLDD